MGCSNGQCRSMEIKSSREPNDQHHNHEDSNVQSGWSTWHRLHTAQELQKGKGSVCMCVCICLSYRRRRKHMDFKTIQGYRDKADKAQKAYNEVVQSPKTALVRVGGSPSYTRWTEFVNRFDFSWNVPVPVANYEYPTDTTSKVTLTQFEAWGTLLRKLHAFKIQFERVSVGRDNAQLQLTRYHIKVIELVHALKEFYNACIAWHIERPQSIGPPERSTPAFARTPSSYPVFQNIK